MKVVGLERRSHRGLSAVERGGSCVLWSRTKTVAADTNVPMYEYRHTFGAAVESQT